MVGGAIGPDRALATLPPATMRTAERPEEEPETRSRADGARASSRAIGSVRELLEA
jgi:hypothetical protein